jgi:serine/threonine-protein kinase
MSDSDRRPIRSPVQPGDVVAGKYRVERILGAGGMGVVVAATHVELAQPVALKFILPEALSGKQTIERFMREARSAARLKSEHVARVLDVGRDGDLPYMVLELLDGVDLAKLNKTHGPLPVADSVEYVLQACEALVEAHAAQIVHRDLKPQNLFVTRRLNGTPLVKVLDFGIAKAVGPDDVSLTDSHAIIGSPLFMAPEQMRSSKTVDARSDIWALGVVLYELLGGVLPFFGDTVTEVCIKVVNEAPPALDKLRPGLDTKLVAAVMRCLEKEPAKRWQNVAQLAAALEPFSKSAQQGGLVRPWRSFEDTADSMDRPAPTAVFESADDTGPSTKVAVASEEDRAKVSQRIPPGLASTDVTWGQGTGRSSARPAPTPARFTGFPLYAAVAAVVVVVAGTAFYMGRSGTPTEASTPPPPVTTAIPAATTATPAAVETSTSMVPVYPPDTAAAPAKKPALKKATAAPTKPAEPSVTPPPKPADTAQPATPNGAPILR